MADKKGITIVIKKKKPHGHGAHGGAWKVAYADFVTAMMAFFLVMWLLGSDEEIRAAVAQYFNNPSSVWRPDLANDKMLPLGDKTGAGDGVLSGADGAVPDDLVDRPSRPYQLHTQEGEDDGDVIQPLMAGKDIIDIDVLRFSIPIRKVFNPGEEKPSPEGLKSLQKVVGKLTQSYKGVLSVATDPMTVKLANGQSPDPYEFALTRSVNISKIMVENRWINEDHIKNGVRKKPAPELGDEPSKKKARKEAVIEFTLTNAQPLSK